MSPHKMFLMALAAFALLVLGNLSFFMVREGEQAMVLQLGKIARVADQPGLYVRVPLLQQIAYFDKKLLMNDSPSEEVQTHDKKRMVVDSFTRWRIVDVAQFYRSVRNEYGAVQRLNLIVNTAMRNVLGSNNMGDLLGDKRDAMMKQILVAAAKEAAPMGIQIVDVRIKRADLPQENSEAVFRRMRAEREKEAREIRAKGEEEAQKIRADADKQQVILLAEAKRDAQKMMGEGEAKAIAVTGAAFSKDPGFYKFTRSLEAYRASMAASNTIMVVDPGSEFLKTMVAP